MVNNKKEKALDFFGFKVDTNILYDEITIEEEIEKLEDFTIDLFSTIMKLEDRIEKLEKGK